MSTKIKNKELIEKIFENNSIDGTDNKMVNGSNTEYKIYNTINIFNSEITNKNEK